MKDKVLDDLDKEILKLLVENAKMPSSKIAEKVFVSTPTVNARILELTKTGVIKGYHAEVDPDVLVDTIKCYINIEVEPSARETLCAILRASSSVISCDRVTGEYSLMVQAVFKNICEMDVFINEIQNHGKTKTQIVFSTIIPTRSIVL